jgi:hypothetical protein
VKSNRYLVDKITFQFLSLNIFSLDARSREDENVFCLNRKQLTPSSTSRPSLCHHPAPSRMVLHNALQRLHPKWPRRNMLQWGGMLAVGVAAVGLRSITSGGRSSVVTPLSTLTTPSFKYIRHNLKAFSRRSSFSTITSTSRAMGITPPQPPPEWTHTPEDVGRLTKEAIDSHRAVEDQIGALQPSDCTYESVSGLPCPVE